MYVREDDLTTCACSINAAEPVHDTMGHYLSTYGAATLDRSGSDLIVSSDAGAVAPVRQSLVSVTPIAAGYATPRRADEDGWWATLAATVPVQVVSRTDPIALLQVAASGAEAASVAGAQL